MSKLAVDLRVLRTKQSIKDALVSLIEDKGFEAMTVKDITDKAKINRGTFYSHYHDKYDLMDKCQGELIQEMEVKIIRNIPQLIEGLKTDGPGAVPLAVPVPFFEFLNDNKSLIKALLGPKGDVSFQAKMKAFLSRALFAGNQDSVFRAEHLLVPREYLSSYIASAHIGVIQEWLNAERGESPQEIAQIISTMTVNGPFFAAGIKK